MRGSGGRGREGSRGRGGGVVSSFSAALSRRHGRVQWLRFHRHWEDIARREGRRACSTAGSGCAFLCWACFFFFSFLRILLSNFVCFSCSRCSGSPGCSLVCAFYFFSRISFILTAWLVLGFVDVLVRWGLFYLFRKSIWFSCSNVQNDPIEERIPVSCFSNDRSFVYSLLVF